MIVLLASKMGTEFHVTVQEQSDPVRVLPIST